LVEVFYLATRTNGKEYRMRLTSALVERTLNQFEAEVIPDSHPVIPQLKGVFGDHTFFLNRSGLNIVEPTETSGAGVQAGNVVELASWTSMDPPKLAPHDPVSTDVVVVLEIKH
jgi:hypothetical protein